MQEIWQTLYKKTQEKRKKLSPFVNKGEYKCVLRTEKNNIYVGTNIISDNLTMSAEKNAILQMINANDSNITHVLILNELEEILLPCEDSLLNLYALATKECVILKNNKFETILLEKLLPSWFGTFRM